MLFRIHRGCAYANFSSLVPNERIASSASSLMGWSRIWCIPITSRKISSPVQPYLSPSSVFTLGVVCRVSFFILRGSAVLSTLAQTTAQDCALNVSVAEMLLGIGRKLPIL
jgi:hypothetical protein